MKVQKRLKKMALLCGLLLCIPLFVDAKNSNTSDGKAEVCVEAKNGNDYIYYEIGGGTDPYFGSAVEPYYITHKNIEGSNVYNTNYDFPIQPPGCFCKDGDISKCLNVKDDNTIECNDEYRFSFTNKDRACTITKNDTSNARYEFDVCPSNQEDIEVVSKMRKKMYMEFDSKSGEWVVTFFGDEKDPESIDSKYVGHISARLVTQRDGKFLVNADGTPQDYMVIYSNDVKVGIRFKPGTEFYLVFYLDSEEEFGDCNGSRIGYIRGAVPATIENSEYNKPLCTAFRKEYEEDSIEGRILSECYEKYISADKYSNIESIIIANWNKIVDLHGKISANETTLTSSNNFTCLFENNSNTVNIKENFSTKKGILKIPGTGTYWAAYCEETISIEYDDPKVSLAGSGFDYEAKVTIDRTCSPYKLAEPKYLPDCTYSIECWGGPTNHTGEAGAGPNEDFDNCINDCDGGNYTQKCINSCYNKVYDNTFSYLSDGKLKDNAFLIASKEDYDVIRLAQNDNVVLSTDKECSNFTSVPTNLPISSCCSVNSNDSSQCEVEGKVAVTCEDNGWCTSEHGVNFLYFDSCLDNEESAVCYEVYVNSPCVEGEGYYEKQVNVALDEYNAVIEAIKTFDQTTDADDKYEIVIDEDYNIQEDGSYQNKVTIFNNTEGDQYTIFKDIRTEAAKVTYLGKDRLAAAEPNNEESKEINVNINNYTISKTITLNIGSAYISKVDGNDVKYNATNEAKDSVLENSNSYHSAGNQYFTRLDTRIVNSPFNWPYYNEEVTSDSTDDYTKNIRVSFYNIGSWNQWGTEGTGVSALCLYGTYSSGECPPNDPECPDPSAPPGDLQYIFRPINLGDIFPNDRNARFNWTGTVNNSTNTSTGAALTKDESLYDDAVDPETLIQKIESKNETIYNVTSDSSEIDYEFVLTTENIRNIRKYNKNVRDYNGDGWNNYLDYNMNCIKNTRGQEVCISRFLDNVNGNSGSSVNDNFISYNVNGYGMPERRSIAGCNNAIGGTSCDYISR